MSDDEGDDVVRPGLPRAQSGCLLCRNRSQSQSQFCNEHTQHFTEDEAAKHRGHDHGDDDESKQQQQQQQQQSPAAVIRCGWVTKRGHGPRYNWRRRWARLCGPILSYHADETSLEELGTVFLIDADMQEFDKHPDGRENVLIVTQREDLAVDAKHMTYFFAFENKDDRTAWHAALLQASSSSPSALE